MADESQGNNIKYITQLQFFNPDSGTTETFHIKDAEATNENANFAQKIVDLVYPVGSLYITHDPDFDPNTSFAHSRWAKLPDGIYIGATTDEEIFGRKEYYANDLKDYNDTNGVSKKGLKINTGNRILTPVLNEGETDIQSKLNEYTNNFITESENEIKIRATQLPEHSHEVQDPGHQHKITTYGDDYAYTGGVGQQPGNFSRDGSNDMTQQNDQYGLRTAIARTGIKLGTAFGNGKDGQEDFDKRPKTIYRVIWERVY